MKCPTCRHENDHPITGICANCQIRLSQQLHAIRATWYQAHATLLPGRSGSQSGGSEHKIGVNVTALSWVNGAPILNILGEWERLIREERGLIPVGRLRPLGTEDEIDRLTRFHLAHLDWASLQPWADEYALEVRDLHAQGRSACGERDTGMRIDCPGELEEGGLCGRRLTIPDDPEAVIYCRQCHTSWTQARLAAVAMAVAEVEIMLPIAEVAHLTGVTEQTLRRWSRQGAIARRGPYLSLKDAQRMAVGA